MARKARVELAGAVYHVLDRGDRREAIFRDDADRERFLATLGEVCGRTGWRVHAWVLMGSRAERDRVAEGEHEGRRGSAVNHYHLLIETPQANLVAGMRWFQTTVTARFNRRHRLTGHLFQGKGVSVQSLTNEVKRGEGVSVQRLTNEARRIGLACRGALRAPPRFQTAALWERTVGWATPLRGGGGWRGIASRQIRACAGDPQPACGTATESTSPIALTSSPPPTGALHRKVCGRPSFVFRGGPDAGATHAPADQHHTRGNRRGGHHEAVIAQSTIASDAVT